MLLMALGLDAETMMPQEKRTVAAKAKKLLLSAHRNSRPVTTTIHNDEHVVTRQQHEEVQYASFCNRHLNRKLQAIHDADETDVDKAPATWEYFSLMVYNAEQLIGGSLHMPSLLRLGTMLKEKGDQIDYPKLEMWIQQVHLSKPVNWLTTILTEVFKIDADEIQYEYRPHPKAASMLYVALHKLLARIEKVARKPRSLSKAILLPLTSNSPRYYSGQRMFSRRITLRYAPREALPLLWNSFNKRIEAIEE